jgi:hypothetical protein
VFKAVEGSCLMLLFLWLSFPQGICFLLGHGSRVWSSLFSNAIMVEVGA